MTVSTDSAAVSRRTGTLRALGHPSFRRLWIASSLWYVNRMMEMVVLSWLVLELTSSPSQVAFVGVSRMAPMFLLGLVAGSVADRFVKKRVMQATQITNLVVVVGMLLIISLGSIQPWHVFVASFVTGSAWTVDFAARRSYFAELFEPDGLGNAVSLDVAALTGSAMLGPILGGTLIPLIDYSGVYLVMLVLYAIGFILLMTVEARPIVARTSGSSSVANNVVEAVRMIGTTRALWAALTITVSLNFFGFPYMQMVPIIARDELEVGPVLYGLLGAAAGLGSLTGSLFIASRTIRNKGSMYSLGAILMVTGVFLFALSPVYQLSLLFLIVAGFGMSGFATMQPVIALQAVPPAMRGRAMGAIALGIGASPIGMFLVGQMAEAWGPRTALAVLTGTGFVVLNGVRLVLPELRKIREAVYETPLNP
jgi:MFS family permease